MILMGLNDGVFLSNLPGCDDVPVGTPCVTSDSTPLFLPSCDSVPVGTACDTGVSSSGPSSVVTTNLSTAPWYKTPFGIVGIVAALAGGVFLMTKLRGAR